MKYIYYSNGLSPGPRKLIKLRKPPIGVLILEEIILAIYMDDLITLGETYEESHPDKSNFLPTQKIRYLRFTFDSVNMLMSVTDGKKDKIEKSYNYYLKKEPLKIQELASLIGTLTTTFTGPLHYIA